IDVAVDVGIHRRCLCAILPRPRYGGCRQSVRFFEHTAGQVYSIPAGAIWYLDIGRKPGLRVIVKPIAVKPEAVECGMRGLAPDRYPGLVRDLPPAKNDASCADSPPLPISRLRRPAIKALPFVPSRPRHPDDEPAVIAQQGR